VPGIHHIQLAAVKELAELAQVGAICIECVPGEAPLKLEVGEEVEPQPLQLGTHLCG
jgi:hypothetical protein